MRLLCKHMHIVQNHTLSLLIVSRSYWIALFVGSVWMARLDLWVTSDVSTVCNGAKTGQGEAVLVSILAFSLVFHTRIHENRHFRNQAGVALNPLVSLFGCLVARSARISVERHTHRPSIITLVAHARRGLIRSRCVPECRDTPTSHCVTSVHSCFWYSNL